MNKFLFSGPPFEPPFMAALRAGGSPEGAFPLWLKRTCNVRIKLLTFFQSQCVKFYLNRENLHNDN